MHPHEQIVYGLQMAPLTVHVGDRATFANDDDERTIHGFLMAFAYNYGKVRIVRFPPPGKR